MSDVKCGTFTDMTFGGVFRRKRIEKSLSLRGLGLLSGMDAANISHMEQSFHSPPNSREKVIRLVRPLKLSGDEIDFMCQLAFSFHMAKLQERFAKKGGAK